MDFYRVGWNISGGTQSHGPVSLEQHKLPTVGSCCFRIRRTHGIVMLRSRQIDTSGGRCGWTARREFAAASKDHSRLMAAMGATSISIGHASSLLTHTCSSKWSDDLRNKSLAYQVIVLTFP